MALHPVTLRHQVRTMLENKRDTETGSLAQHEIDSLAAASELLNRAIPRQRGQLFACDISDEYLQNWPPKQLIPVEHSRKVYEKCEPRER